MELSICGRLKSLGNSRRLVALRRGRGALDVAVHWIDERSIVAYKRRMIEVRQTRLFQQWRGGLREVRARAAHATMPIETIPYDPAEDLADPRDQADLLADAFASGDRKYITIALGVVARARGMSEIAEKAGVNRPIPD